LRTRVCTNDQQAQKPRFEIDEEKTVGNLKETQAWKRDEWWIWSHVSKDRRRGITEVERNAEEGAVERFANAQAFDVVSYEDERTRH
jgi:hypothetical protein